MNSDPRSQMNQMVGMAWNQLQSPSVTGGGFPPLGLNRPPPSPPPSAQSSVLSVSAAPIKAEDRRDEDRSSERRRDEERSSERRRDEDRSSERRRDEERSSERRRASRSPSSHSSRYRRSPDRGGGRWLRSPRRYPRQSRSPIPYHHRDRREEGRSRGVMEERRHRERSRERHASRDTTPHVRLQRHLSTDTGRRARATPFPSPQLVTPTLATVSNRLPQPSPPPQVDTTAVLKRQLDEAKQRLDTMTRERDEAREQLADREKLHTDNRVILCRQRDEALEKVGSLETELGTMRQQLNTVTRERNEARSARTKMEQAEARLGIELRMERGRSEKLKAQATAAEEGNKFLSREIAKFQAEQTNDQDRMRRLGQQLDSKKKEVEGLQMRLAAVEPERDQALAEVSHLQHENTQLRQQSERDVAEMKHHHAVLLENAKRETAAAIEKARPRPRVDVSTGGRRKNIDLQALIRVCKESANFDAALEEARSELAATKRLSDSSGSTTGPAKKKQKKEETADASRRVTTQLSIRGVGAGAKTPGQWGRSKGGRK